MLSENIIRLEQMRRFFFDQETTLMFIKYLQTQTTVIAPQRKGEASYAFEEVSDAAVVVTNYSRTIQPLKKYFLPPVETLISFNLDNNSFEKNPVEQEARIFFAIHSYDMQSIIRLDYSFSQGPPDTNYFKRRNKSKFIGISYTPDEWHFSKSVGIEIEKLEGFCLFFEPVDNGYLVFEVDDDGAALLSGFGKGVRVNTPIDFEIKEKNFKAKIKYHFNRLPQVFEHVYNSKVWKEVAERCVGCGTCNLLCATCYCFDVRDEVELNVLDGQRQRFWDSCMLNTFAQVAGGENFRQNLDSRTRHRLFRKFKYITDQSGELHCIGCGRCSRFCPASINIIGIINDLIIDYTDSQQKQAI